MRYKVFKLKSEMGDNRKTQRFFRRHWNNRLAKKLGLGTYSMLSGWSSGTVGELYGIASRNDQIKNRLDTMLRYRTGKTKTFNMNLAKMVLYLLLFSMLVDQSSDLWFSYDRARKAKARALQKLNPEESLRIQTKYAAGRARGRERAELLQQFDKTITQIARRDRFEEGFMNPEAVEGNPWDVDGWLSYALRLDRFEEGFMNPEAVEDDGTINPDYLTRTGPSVYGEAARRDRFEDAQAVVFKSGRRRGRR